VEDKVRCISDPEHWPIPGGVGYPGMGPSVVGSSVVGSPGVGSPRTDFSQLINCPEFVPRRALGSDSGQCPFLLLLHQEPQSATRTMSLSVPHLRYIIHVSPVDPPLTGTSIGVGCSVDRPGGGQRAGQGAWGSDTGPMDWQTRMGGSLFKKGGLESDLVSRGLSLLGLQAKFIPES